MRYNPDLKLQVGKTYQVADPQKVEILGDGSIIKIVSENEGIFKGHTGMFYQSDGRDQFGIYPDFGLVKEVQL